VALVTSRSVVRQDALTALRSSHTASRPAAVPWLGAILTALGVGLTVWASAKARTGANDPNAWRESIEASYVAVGAGALFALAGVLSAGWLIQQLARLPWRGLTMRMAMRDSSRNLGRTVATSAAMSGATVIALLPLITLGAMDAANRTSHEPWGRAGLLTVTMGGYGSDKAGGPADAAQLARIADQVMGSTAEVAVTTALARSALDDQWNVGDEAVHEMVLANDDAVRLLTGRLADDALAAVDTGQVLVFTRDLISADGTITFNRNVFAASGSVRTEEHQAPAHLVEEIRGMPVILPAAVVEQIGMTGEGDLPEAYLSYDRALTQDERSLINARVRQAGFDWYLATDTGPDQDIRRFLPWLAAGSVALALAVAVV
ncbi:MAG: hypothetical protein Q4F67_17210, partial [Propionibacteriaceae bacterium]|nr:hypothetical protein [Propionibacteriaceae bacterium]